jgi:hypothetical protein
MLIAEFTHNRMTPGSTIPASKAPAFHDTRLP